MATNHKPNRRLPADKTSSWWAVNHRPHLCRPLNPVHVAAPWGIGPLGPRLLEPGVPTLPPWHATATHAVRPGSCRGDATRRRDLGRRDPEWGSPCDAAAAARGGSASDWNGRARDGLPLARRRGDARPAAATLTSGQQQRRQRRMTNGTCGSSSARPAPLSSRRPQNPMTPRPSWGQHADAVTPGFVCVRNASCCGLRPNPSRSATPRAAGCRLWPFCPLGPLTACPAAD
jgi:hypothetical protein